MKKIHILHVLEATTGGTRRHLYYLMKYLDKNQFRLSLMYSDERGPWFENDLRLYRQAGIELHELPMRREISPLHDIRVFIRMTANFLSSDYDLIHAHSSKAGVLARLAGTVARVPVIIYSPHCFAFQYASRGRALYRAIEKHTSFLYDHLICVSKGEERAAREQHICSPSKIRVIHNVHDSFSFMPPHFPDGIRKTLGIPPDKLIVGMVACLRPQKGYRFFIEAIPGVLERYQNVHFIIAGDGEHREQVARYIHEAGVHASVSMVGHQENIADYLALMDIFVLSSLWEGLPYSILEAMAFGLPVIATNITGNNELIRDGVNGFLVHPCDSAEITDRVVQLLADSGLRKEFGNKAQEMSKKSPSIRGWADTYACFYKEVLKNAHRRKNLSMQFLSNDHA